MDLEPGADEVQPEDRRQGLQQLGQLPGKNLFCCISPFHFLLIPRDH